MHGLGRLQVRIRRAFLAYPERLFYTSELAEWAYPRLKGPLQRKHRWAIVRAARRVAIRDGRDGSGVRWRANPAMLRCGVCGGRERLKGQRYYFPVMARDKVAT